MTLRFAELTRAELRDRTGHLVVIPIAATEQHGDHLPVMTDAAIVTELAELVCQGVQPATAVLLAPTIAIGVSGHHVPFGGTLSVTSATFIGVLVDVVTALRAQGFARVLFLNGHGGNDASMRVALERLALAARDGESAAGLSYWAFAAASVDAGIPVPGHAGSFETSMMLAIRPDLVRMPLPESLRTHALASNELAGIQDPRPADWRSSGGVTDNAAGASAERGQRSLSGISQAIIAQVIDHVRLLDERRSTEHITEG